MAGHCLWQWITQAVSRPPGSRKPSMTPVQHVMQRAGATRRRVLVVKAYPGWDRFRVDCEECRTRCGGLQKRPCGCLKRLRCGEVRFGAHAIRQTDWACTGGQVESEENCPLWSGLATLIYKRFPAEAYTT